ncbi:alpha/beta hydrolase fold domain-containing protein [Rhodococcus sp. NPDC058514]|uniref:alpha/beta hydrolase fold domain-containing protein n=1 Tax=unclassified Rhodococcus (in: high G+C Gram-positive bacteria) TaxID=192944 RepID=UPI00366098CF
MTSLANRLMPAALALRGSRRVGAVATRREMAGRALRPRSFSPPRGLDRRVDIRLERSAAGWPVYSLAAHGASRRDLDSVLYLHGGSYFREITRQHWQLVAAMARSLPVEVVVPIYPLAPVSTADAVVPAAADLAEVLIAERGADRFCLLGDSAGGGMALAVAVALRERTLAPPRRTVLISPWLDITVSDPAISVLAPQDPWLCPDGLRVAGDAYRGALDPADSRVSPIEADLDDLGHVTVFTGTRDILNADARRLRERMALGNTGFEFHEEPGMLHVYPLLPTPEGRIARRTLRAVIDPRAAVSSAR